jgi:arylsulfatase
LIDDPRERHDVVSMNTWVYVPTNKLRHEFEASLRREPPIAVGTPDPYGPPTEPSH